MQCCAKPGNWENSLGSAVWDRQTVSGREISQVGNDRESLKSGLQLIGTLSLKSACRSLFAYSTVSEWATTPRSTQAQLSLCLGRSARLLAVEAPASLRSPQLAF